MKKLTKEEQENLEASELMDKKTSELIDAIHEEQDSEKLDKIYEEVDKRYPETTINYLREEYETFEKRTHQRLDKIEERLSRIDNHYLIINKLDKMMTLLEKKK